MQLSFPSARPARAAAIGWREPAFAAPRLGDEFGFEFFEPVGFFVDLAVERDGLCDEVLEHG